MSDQAQAAPAAAPATEAAAQSTEAVEATEAQATESSENTEASVEASAETKKQEKKVEKAIEKELKKYKLKVDGEELEVDEQELMKHAQMGKAASKRMQEAAQLRKDAEEFVRLLKSDPRRVLSDPLIGVDLKKFAEDIINGEIEEMKKSPEQREKEKLQKELEDIRKKLQKEEEDRKSIELQRMQEKVQVELDNEISEALSTSTLPQSPYMIKRMADIMLDALNNNISLSAKDVVPLLQREITGEFKQLVSSTADDYLEELLGKDNISRLRKRSMQKLKQVVESAKDVKPTGIAETNTAKKESTPKKISMKEFLGN